MLRGPTTAPGATAKPPKSATDRRAQLLDTRDRKPGVSQTDKADLRWIPLSEIGDAEDPVRLEYDPEEMGVLRASMTEMGMIDPILVMPRAAASGNLKYEVLDGQRRVLVARALGWERVRCLVVPPEGLAIEAIRLHQNQAHAKMTAWEESVYYTRLCDRLDLNFEELCVAVRQSAEYVSDRLLLQRAELETQAALQNGLITLAIARELRRLKNRQWELYYLDQCLRSGTGSKILHGWITDHLRRGGLVQQTVSDQPPIVTATPPPPAELLCGFCGKPSGGRQLMNVWVHTDEYGTVSRMLGEMLARVEAETQPAPPDNKVTG